MRPFFNFLYFDYFRALLIGIATKDRVVNQSFANDSMQKSKLDTKIKYPTHAGNKISDKKDLLMEKDVPKSSKICNPDILIYYRFVIVDQTPGIPANSFNPLHGSFNSAVNNPTIDNLPLEQQFLLQQALNKNPELALNVGSFFK